MSLYTLTRDAKGRLVKLRDIDPVTLRPRPRRTKLPTPTPAPTEAPAPLPLRQRLVGAWRFLCGS